MTQFSDRKVAESLDMTDPLITFRSKFYIQNSDLIYLDGNSLGRLLMKSSDSIAETTHEAWGENLISSWNEGWYDLPNSLGNRLAPLIGASEDEVIMADSTSVNLYKLADASLRIQKDRKRIVSDTLNFPTDLYILQGIIKNLNQGHELCLAGSVDGIHPNLDELESLIDDKTALVVLSLVAFKSGYLYDMERITKMAHTMGAMVIWDLSHATGALPVHLNHCEADMAVGCTYKYLNGGPGSPAFLYVRKEIQDRLVNPIQGWFGESNPFDFRLDYREASTIRKFLTGTPPIISMSAIGPGVDLLVEAGIERIRAKSLLQSRFLIDMAIALLLPLGFTIGSPMEENRRGSHVTLRHPEAYRICQALIQPRKSTLRIIPDFREPNNIRFGLTPLYTSYLEIWQAISRTRDIVENREYLEYASLRMQVT